MNLQEGMKIYYNVKLYYIWRIVNKSVFLLNCADERPMFIRCDYEVLQLECLEEIEYA
jgi:hypothetical protein